VSVKKQKTRSMNDDLNDYITNIKHNNWEEEDWYYAFNLNNMSLEELKILKRINRIDRRLRASVVNYKTSQKQLTKEKNGTRYVCTQSTKRGVGLLAEAQ
jgi:hypothetical protein